MFVMCRSTTVALKASTPTRATAVRDGSAISVTSMSTSVSHHPVHQVSPVKMLSTATCVSVPKVSQVMIFFTNYC